MRTLGLHFRLRFLHRTLRIIFSSSKTLTHRSIIFPESVQTKRVDKTKIKFVL